MPLTLQDYQDYKRKQSAVGELSATPAEVAVDKQAALSNTLNSSGLGRGVVNTSVLAQMTPSESEYQQALQQQDVSSLEDAVKFGGARSIALTDATYKRVDPSSLTGTKGDYNNYLYADKAGNTYAIVDNEGKYSLTEALVKKDDYGDYLVYYKQNGKLVPGNYLERGVSEAYIKAKNQKEINKTYLEFYKSAISRFGGNYEKKIKPMVFYFGGEDDLSHALVWDTSVDLFRSFTTLNPAVQKLLLGDYGIINSLEAALKTDLPNKFGGDIEKPEEMIGRIREKFSNKKEI